MEGEALTGSVGFDYIGLLTVFAVAIAVGVGVWVATRKDGCTFSVRAMSGFFAVYRILLALFFIWVLFILSYSVYQSFVLQNEVSARETIDNAITRLTAARIPLLFALVEYIVSNIDKVLTEAGVDLSGGKKDP